MDSLYLLALIWTVVFAANVLAIKTRMVPVLWFLALGSLLANFDLIAMEDNEFISGMANLGIILIMFALGFEENINNFLSSIKRSWGIALFGAIAPFSAAYLVADYYWQDKSISLMCGLTMTATAVSLTMISLQNIGLGKSAAATRIMTSAVLDDIASLALVAILVPIASGEGPFDLILLVTIALKAILFFVAVTLLGGVVFPHNVPVWMRRIPFLGKYGMRHLLDFGRHSTLTVLLLALLVGLLANEFGFHPAIGAYMAGLILKEEYFQRKQQRGSWEDTKRIVENMAFSWIGPVFFVDLGAKIIFDGGILFSVFPNIVMLVVSVFFAQVISAALAAKFTSGMDWAGGMMVGFGMLGRAELAFVVMDIAYVQNKILNTEAFYTLMITAFVLNILVPITIALWKPFYSDTLELEKNDEV